ncbi:hypothetical protein [Paenibacillus jilunlii]|nr:hypothetical protein [Paenibacillus jilunlii]
MPGLGGEIPTNLLCGADFGKLGGEIPPAFLLGIAVRAINGNALLM